MLTVSFKKKHAYSYHYCICRIDQLLEAKRVPARMDDADGIYVI